MHRTLFGSVVCGLALSLGTLGSATAGKVQVRWLEPDKFRDAGRGSVERERTLADLAQVFRQWGAQLPDDQTLTLDVSDVDLAGQLIPGRIEDVRVLQGRADWPRISMRYTLTTGSRVVKSGQADLADMNYLSGLPSSASLIHEKRMLDRWFKAEFAAR
jgi:hypothetical protein